MHSQELRGYDRNVDSRLMDMLTMRGCVRRGRAPMFELKMVPLDVEGIMRCRTRTICQDEARAQRWKQGGASFYWEGEALSASLPVFAGGHWYT